MKLNKITGYLAAGLAVISMTGCSEYTPNGYEEVPSLPTASNLTWRIDNHDVVLNWNLPTNTPEKITGVILYQNGNYNAPTELDPTATTWTVKGQDMEVEYYYTVKVKYENNHVSTGVSTGNIMLPVEQLKGVSNLTGSAEGRNVTLNWTLPQATGITGVRVIRDGAVEAATYFEGENLTTCTLKGQKADTEFEYEVQVIYDNHYYSNTDNSKVKVRTEVVVLKKAFLLLAESIADLPDDDEQAAATWAYQQGYEMITVDKLATDLDPEEIGALWIMVDRIGIGAGWDHLPADLVSAASIKAIADFTANGGALYLSSHATQLTVPLNVVPSDMAPTVFADGNGGSGGDIWSINPYLGWKFKDGGDEDFFDRTEHEIYKGLTFEQVNDYPYGSLPLIGPGHREDHNCMWDCNLYGKGSFNNVISNFEDKTNSMVLATWGQVLDHCVAGLVVFNSNAEHGVVVANGLAAYEWNQNSNTNIYQANVEGLTKNIMDYLCK